MFSAYENFLFYSSVSEVETNPSDPPLPTTLTTPRVPSELNPRILTTTDYDELLRPLSWSQMLKTLAQEQSPSAWQKTSNPCLTPPSLVWPISMISPACYSRYRHLVL
jgi:hypothetical protein